MACRWWSKQWWYPYFLLRSVLRIMVAPPDNYQILQTTSNKEFAFIQKSQVACTQKWSFNKLLLLLASLLYLYFICIYVTQTINKHQPELIILILKFRKYLIYFFNKIKNLKIILFEVWASLTDSLLTWIAASRMIRRL